MNCKETRQVLKQRFDEGGDLAHGLPSHVEACAACQAYAVQLRDLDEALMHLPLEIPSANLQETASALVKATQETSSWRSPMVAAAILVLGAGFLGWFYPIEVNPAGMFTEAWAWLAQVDLKEWLALVDPRDAGAFLVSQMHGVWDQYALRAGEYAGAVPPLFSWVTLGAMLLALVAFDGYEAARLRGGNGDTQARPQTTNQNGH